MENDKNLPIEPLVVDIQTAARLLNVCERTIRTLTKRGELPVVRIASTVRYSMEDLTEFIRQRSRREFHGGNDKLDSTTNSQKA